MVNALKGFILLVVILVLGGCSASVNKETTMKSEDKAGQAVELKGQSLTDIRKLVTPDQLVYLHNGVNTMITKKNPKFQKIIQLNNSRQTKKLADLKLTVDYKSTENNGDYLIYLYDTKNLVPVYFKLVPSPDEKFENWLINYYGSNAVPSVDKVIRTNINAFGSLASADELLEYLNIRY